MLLGPSNTAGKVDDAFIFIVVCCVLLLAVVTVEVVRDLPPGVSHQ